MLIKNKIFKKWLQNVCACFFMQLNKSKRRKSGNLELDPINNSTAAPESGVGYQ